MVKRASHVIGKPVVPADGGAGLGRVADGTPTRDDADVRGEHRYTSEQTPSHPPDEVGPLTRRPGHYAAGAHGTQDVGSTIDDERKPGDD